MNKLVSTQRSSNTTQFQATLPSKTTQPPPKAPTSSCPSEHTFSASNTEKQTQIHKHTGQVKNNESQKRNQLYKHTEKQTASAPSKTASNTATQTTEAAICHGIKKASDKRPFNLVAQTARLICETRKAKSEHQKAAAEPSKTNQASAALHTAQVVHSTAEVAAKQVIKQKATKQAQEAIVSQMRENAGLNKQPKTIMKGNKKIPNPQRPHTPPAMKEAAKKAAKKAINAAHQGTEGMAKAAGVQKLKSKALETSAKTLGKTTRTLRFLSRGVPILAAGTATLDAIEANKIRRDPNAGSLKKGAAYCAAALSAVGVKVPAVGYLAGIAAIVRDAAK